MHFNSDDITSEKVWRTSGEYPMKYVRGKSTEVEVEYNLKSKIFSMIIIGHRINLFNEEWWLNGRNDGNNGIWVEQRTSLSTDGSRSFHWNERWYSKEECPSQRHLKTGLKTNKWWDGILRYGTAATHQSNYLKHIKVFSILIVQRSLTESAHAESEDMQVLTPENEVF
jgi:hypothetical protein